MARQTPASGGAISAPAGSRPRAVMIGLATLALAGLAFQKAGGMVLARGAPETASRIAPHNAQALAAIADTSLANDPLKNAPNAAAMATRSLRAQSFNARAVRTLGFAIDLGGEVPKAATLVALSERLSRRDKATQLWLIERAVSAGDVAGALRHYDIALRTSKQAPEVLYPILTDALEQEDVRRAFAPYVRTRPAWVEGFLAYAISHTDRPETIAGFLLDVPGALADVRNREIGARLIDRLLATGAADATRRFSAAMPGSAPARLYSPAVSERDRDGRDGALGWQLPSTPNGQAAVDASPVGPVLHVEGTAGAVGRIAQKTLLLSPGRYSFSVRASTMALGPEGALRWRLACVGGTRGELWSHDMATASAVVDFAVGSDCATQSLTLDVLPGDSVDGASADIAMISIRRG